MVWRMRGATRAYDGQGRSADGPGRAVQPDRGSCGTIIDIVRRRANVVRNHNLQVRRTGNVHAGQITLRLHKHVSLSLLRCAAEGKTPRHRLGLGPVSTRRGLHDLDYDLHGLPLSRLRPVPPASLRNSVLRITATLAVAFPEAPLRYLNWPALLCDSPRPVRTPGSTSPTVWPADAAVQ